MAEGTTFKLTVISLGAGVQSSTMALMAAAGEISPMPDAAIFADTQAEPQSVYRWLDWLEGKLPFPIYRVTAGDLAKESVKLHKSAKSGRVYTQGGIPLFLRNRSGGKGMMWRICTSTYKIDPIHRKLREMLGLKRVTSAEPLVSQWIGISVDEEQRAKPARMRWVINRWPLLELGIDRQDCFEWMAKRGFPTPPRSACVFCPYHSDAEWLRLKTEEPEEFARAVEWERTYQAAVAQDEVLDGTPFLHRSLIQIGEVDFKVEQQSTQLVFEECEGMCGV